MFYPPKYMVNDLTSTSAYPVYETKVISFDISDDYKKLKKQNKKLRKKIKELNKVVKNQELEKK